jgi:hypothetical protein
MAARPRLLTWWAACWIALLAVWQFFRAGWAGPSCWTKGINGDLPSLCVDPYWINQWLKSYAGGFSKRGLIGELLRHLFPGGIDLLWLNVTALLLLIAIALLLGLLVQRLLRTSDFSSLLITSLLLLAPFGKSLAETALDPLQLCVLLVAVVLLTPPQSSTRDWVLIAAYVLGSLIYEGCLLLLLPVGFWLMRPGIGRWLPLVLAAAFLLVFQQQDPSGLGEAARQALVAINPYTGQELRYQDGAGLAASVSFGFNVKQEFSRYLTDSLRDTISRVSRSLGVVVVYGLSLLTAMGRGNSKEQRKLALIWLSWVPVALPFVLITHDWLRYGVILLLLAMLVAVAQTQSREPLQEIESWWSLSVPEASAVAVLTLSTVIGPATQDVRKFLPADYFYMALLMLLVALVLFCWNQSRLARLG